MKKIKSKVIISPDLKNKPPKIETLEAPLFERFFWRSNIWASLLIFILPFVLYWQTINFGYVLDDTIAITENSFTKQGIKGIDELLTTESFTGYFGEQKNLVQGNRYRPLSFITFAIEFELNGGLNPAMSHFINILLYGLLGLLIFRLMAYLFREEKVKDWWFGLSFLIAIFYIMHPIHTEAVANIKGRDEIMSMLFSIATLNLMMKYNASNKMTYLISAMGVFFLALLSKENAITFLAVIPMTLYFFTSVNIWKAVKRVLPLVVVSILYLVVRFLAAGIPDMGQEIMDLMNNPFVGMSFGERTATISYTLLKYIQLYIIPHPLSHDYYPYAIPKLGWENWQSLVSLAVYTVLLVWAVRGWSSKSISSYGLFFYFATLSIASNVFINLGTFMNERFIFMASLGLTIVTIYIIREKLYNLIPLLSKYLAILLLGVMLVGYGFKTIDRVGDWESALTLNRSAVEGGTNSARANSFMATAIYEEVKTMPNSDEKNAKLEDAYRYVKKAINIYPRYGNANLMLAGISAEMYGIHKDQTRLLQDFKTVAEQRPDTRYITEYMEYLEVRTDNVEEIQQWYQNVGIGILQSENSPTQWAIHYLLKAYNYGNKDPKVLKGLVDGYRILGDQNNANRFNIELQNK